MGYSQQVVTQKLVREGEIIHRVGRNTGQGPEGIRVIRMRQGVSSDSDKQVGSSSQSSGVLGLSTSRSPFPLFIYCESCLSLIDKEVRVLLLIIYLLFFVVYCKSKVRVKESIYKWVSV
jgi:hypothetical protein